MVLNLAPVRLEQLVDALASSTRCSSRVASSWYSRLPQVFPLRRWTRCASVRWCATSCPMPPSSRRRARAFTSPQQLQLGRRLPGVALVVSDEGRHPARSSKPSSTSSCRAAGPAPAPAERAWAWRSAGDRRGPRGRSPPATIRRAAPNSPTLPLGDAPRPLHGP
jgi:hypothetical protein